MTWVRTMLRTVWAEIFALFVDDAGFALSILAALAVVWLGLWVLYLPPAWMGSLLFAGLAVILLESTLRRADR